MPRNDFTKNYLNFNYKFLDSAFVNYPNNIVFSNPGSHLKRFLSIFAGTYPAPKETVTTPSLSQSFFKFMSGLFHNANYDYAVFARQLRDKIDYEKASGYQLTSLLNEADNYLTAKHVALDSDFASVWLAFFKLFPFYKECLANKSSTSILYQLAQIAIEDNKLSDMDLALIEQANTTYTYGPYKLYLEEKVRQKLREGRLFLSLADENRGWLCQLILQVSENKALTLTSEEHKLATQLVINLCGNETKSDQEHSVLFALLAQLDIDGDNCQAVVKLAKQHFLRHSSVIMHLLCQLKPASHDLILPIIQTLLRNSSGGYSHVVREKIIHLAQDLSFWHKKILQLNLLGFINQNIVGLTVKGQLLDLLVKMDAMLDKELAENITLRQTIFAEEELASMPEIEGLH